MQQHQTIYQDKLYLAMMLHGMSIVVEKKCWLMVCVFFPQSPWNVECGQQWQFSIFIYIIISSRRSLEDKTDARMAPGSVQWSIVQSGCDTWVWVSLFTIPECRNSYWSERSVSTLKPNNASKFKPKAIKPIKRQMNGDKVQTNCC